MGFLFCAGALFGAVESRKENAYEFEYYSFGKAGARHA